MNWEKVNEFVLPWATRHGLPQDMAGMSIVLVDFQSELDCAFFYPGRDMVSHKACTMGIAKLARDRGARTLHSTILPEHYRAWLAAAKRVDSEESREEFIESRYKIGPAA